MTLPVPAWLKRLPVEKQRYALRRLLLRTAALYATEDGHLHALGAKVGLAPRSLAMFMTLEKRKKMPRRIAEDVQTVTNGVIRAADLMDEPEA